MSIDPDRADVLINCASFTSRSKVIKTRKRVQMKN